MTGRIAPRLLVVALVATAACDKDESPKVSDAAEAPETKTSSAQADASAFTKYQRRSMTSEARVQLATLFDAASAYFNEEHISRGDLAVIGAGGSIKDSAPHECPNDGRAKGSAGITPPLSVKCSEGPGGRCVPVAGEPNGPGQYSMAEWTDNKVWSGLNFMQEQGHYFHYEFHWENDPSGYGGCKFTAQAFADLDDDGVFSTFERTAAADEEGVDAAAGLYIDQEIE